MEKYKAPRSDGIEAENWKTFREKAVKIVWCLCSGIRKQEA